MKYKLPLLSLLSLSAMANGHWYAGAGIGSTILNSTVSNTQTINFGSQTVYGTSHPKLSKSSLIGQLQGGYIKNLNTFFALGEVFIMTPSNKAIGSDQYGWDNGASSQFINTLTKTSTMGISGKIGVPVHEKWGIFASMGVLRAKFKFENGYTDATPQTITSRKSRTTWGISPGIGVIYKVTPKTPLRLEYNYEIYKTLKANQIYVAGTPNGGSFYSDAKVNPRYHTVMLSLSYEI